MDVSKRGSHEDGYTYAATSLDSGLGSLLAAPTPLAVLSTALAKRVGMVFLTALPTVLLRGSKLLAVAFTATCTSKPVTISRT